MRRVVLGAAVATATVIGVLLLIPTGTSPLFDPDCDGDVSAVMAFNQGTDYTDDVVALDAEGDLTRVTGDEASWGPSFSPDGSQMAFVRGQGAFSDSLGWDSQAIFVMDADGSDQWPLTGSDGYDEAPAWSPDGEWIAFSTHDALMVAPAVGGDARVVSERGWGTRAIDWSPDSRQLMFAANERRERTSIYVVDRDGSDLTAVSRGLDHIDHLSWSPDGEWIAFSDHADTYTITFEEPSPRLFARDAHTPAFSPDGKQVAYFEEVGDFSRRLVIRPLEGGETRPVEVDLDRIFSFENDLDWLDCS